MVVTKKEIEDSINGKGDFVKIDHLTRFLKNDLPLDLKKLVYIKLAVIYDDKAMHSEAAKMYAKLAEISIAFREKVNFNVREAEMFIKAAQYDYADNSLKKAYTNASVDEQREIKKHIVNFHKNLAAEYEKKDRRSHAIQVYERLLKMNLLDFEKEEARARLKALYEKTGRLREYFSLKG